MCRQLRYLGVPAVVEIHRVGYPVKQSFADFVKRYRCIGFAHPALLSEQLPLAEVCTNLVKMAEAQAAAAPLRRGGAPSATPAASGWFDPVAPLVQLGKSKVFMRRELLPLMERPRRAARGKAAVRVQAYARRRVARRVLALLKAHCLGFVDVLDMMEPPEQLEAAVSVAVRLGEAAGRLDALVVVWEQHAMRPSICDTTERCYAQVASR